jgi:hypothetical protein
LHFVLQEQNCENGDHIVRARGAWFGNRSISAEVDLEAGIYEVLPKIEASRDADAIDVQDVVVKLAERNPQKLRQIGLNYDIANAKPFYELTDAQWKIQEQKKKKDAAEKKQKRDEEDAKEKEDFEAWKKEEKAEYAAWKKERTRNAKNLPQKHVNKVLEETKKNKYEDEHTPALANADAVETKKDTTSPSTMAEETPDKRGEASEPKATNAIAISEAKSDDKASEDEGITQKTPENSLPTVTDVHIAPLSMIDGPESFRPMYGQRPYDVYNNVPRPPLQQQARPAVDNTPKPWNAVCVLGLRVYSQDPKVSIKLIKPKDVEEGAILDVDGTAAGATM